MSEVDDMPPGFSFDLRRWIALAGTDKVNQRKRQVAEITLHAIALEPRLGQSLVLKGGSLLAIAYGSSRFTTDLDFTALEFSEDAPERIKALLDPALIRAAAALGYTNLRCRVQTVKLQPRPTTFATADAPALKITIGSANPTKSNETRSFNAGTAANILELDISFREPLISIDEVSLLGKVELTAAPRTLLVYSLTEIVAEKLRAYLQQKDRDRSRRQDVFDLAYLIQEYGDDLDRAEVFAALQAKSRARGIEPSLDSIDDADLIGRAKRNWNTLKAEVGTIPEFEDCFAVVQRFYRSLPW